MTVSEENDMTDPDKLTAPSDPAELADLIDRLMEQGSGHVDIVADDSGSGLRVSTVKSTDGPGRKGACCQPTELVPEDDEF